MIQQVRDTAGTALFADAAQVNDFQAPASPDAPMIEEWYYVDYDDSGSGYPNGHFRHQQRANVAFCDGHVERVLPEPGSIDPRLPSEYVGRLPKQLFIGATPP